MKRSPIWEIQKESLEEIISLSASVSEVLRRLGMKTTCGGTYRTLMRRIKEEIRRANPCGMGTDCKPVKLWFDSSARFHKGTVMYPEHLLPVLKAMLVELNSTRLEVLLVPAEDQRHCGHKVRVVESNNPWWYREICSRYPSRSKSHSRCPWKHTRVKRRRILEALEKMSADICSKSSFVDDILEVAEEELCRWEEERIEWEERSTHYTVAQLVAHDALNVGVEGSSPSGVTITPSSNGRTQDFDSCNDGSNPSGVTKFEGVPW